MGVDVVGIRWPGLRQMLLGRLYRKGARVGGRGIQDWASFSEGVSGHSGLFAPV